MMQINIRTRDVPMNFQTTIVAIDIAFYTSSWAQLYMWVSNEGWYRKSTSGMRPVGGWDKIPQ